MNNKLKIGITIGDVNGIGLEVILKTLEDKRILSFCTPILYGSTKVASYHKNIIDVKELTLHSAKDIHTLNPNAVNVINCWMENIKISIGQCTEEGGKYAFYALEQAIEDLKAGHIDALVTAPINKKAMQISGFTFPGHTEYLTEKLEAKQNLMMLVSEDLRVALVTNHLPIKQVAASITKELVLEKIQLMNQSLKMDFGISKPAIAVLGLNPHAGDSGVLGNEELDIIIPAIEEAKSLGILAIGPYAADGFFGSSNYTNFDGILAMYHDQGLVPFKALSFGNGVNFTAGLPFIRTSPDHGTGYDIAGKNIADPQSFREALYLAIDSHRLRQDYLEMTKNPLSSVNTDLGDDDEALFDEDDPKNNRRQKSKHSNKRDSKKTPKKASDKKGIADKIASTQVDSEQISASDDNSSIDNSIDNSSNEGSSNSEVSNQKPLSVEERLALANAKKQSKEVEPKIEQELPKVEEKVVTITLADNIMETMEPIANLSENNHSTKEEVEDHLED